MTATDPAFQQAMDRLLLQVNADNVIAVGRAFHQHANRLRGYLRELDRSTMLVPCGGDPVSHDVLRPESLAGKIRQLVDVHWDHCRELEDVASNLEGVAKSYGFTEEEISSSMRAQGK